MASQSSVGKNQVDEVTRTRDVRVRQLRNKFRPKVQITLVFSTNFDQKNKRRRKLHIDEYNPVEWSKKPSRQPTINQYNEVP